MQLNIEELARQAGMNTSMWNYGAGSMAFTLGVEGVARGAVERFAQLVADAVKAEAAKVCAAEKVDYNSTQDDSDAAYNMAVAHCVGAIRAMEVKT